MDTKELCCSVVTVEFPRMGKEFVRVFPLDEQGAMDYALMLCDTIGTGGCTIDVQDGVLDLVTIDRAREGIWLRQSRTNDARSRAGGD